MNQSKYDTTVNINVVLKPHTLFFCKHKTHNHIEAKFHLNNKHILSICPGRKVIAIKPKHSDAY